MLANASDGTLGDCVECKARCRDTGPVRPSNIGLHPCAPRASTDFLIFRRSSICVEDVRAAVIGAPHIWFGHGCKSRWFKVARPRTPPVHPEKPPRILHIMHSEVKHTAICLGIACSCRIREHRRTRENQVSQPRQLVQRIRNCGVATLLVNALFQNMAKAIIVSRVRFQQAAVTAKGKCGDWRQPAGKSYLVLRPGVLHSNNSLQACRLNMNVP